MPKNLAFLLPPYASSTIMGIAICGGAVVAWLQDQVTVKQAIAMAVSGIIAMVIKQTVGTTVVTGPMPVVNTNETTIAPAAGSTTTIKAAKVAVAFMAAMFVMTACSTAQKGATLTSMQEGLDNVRLFCATEQGVVALSTLTGTPVLAKGQTQAYVNAACAVAGGIAVSPPTAPVMTVSITLPPSAGK